jgi:dihydroneopterin aldolase/2-amino-4-hydroxy-6-hydroxymethyldihydropteridine diphosphokinase
MNKIYIKDLEIFAYHGVFEDEKKLGQKFLISVEIDTDFRDAYKNDDLNKTINYGALSDEIKEIFTKEKYDLIETATYKIAKYIITKYDNIKTVKVKVKKPWAPIKISLDYVAVEIELKWHKAYIGIGSNLGDKTENIKQAIKNINDDETKVQKISSLYKTKPVGYDDQEDFINAVFEIKTLLSPKELIQTLLGIENDLKRKRTIKNGPRTIDLDVLLYDDIISNDEDIIIPHPRMHERLFVLTPLKEIAPFALHTLLNKRIFELEEILGDQGVEKVGSLT